MDDFTDWPTGRLLLTAARLVEQEWNAVLAGVGLTHAGFLALHALEDGPSTQRGLAARAYVEEQTIRPVLDRLERHGHIARVRDPADRRRVIVTRTEEGAQAYRAVLESGSAEAVITDRVGDAATLRAELIRLLGGMRPGR
ncbi:MarR family transcriptional regulator [Acrocarpospora phusangensis]|uniref:MarR family transcriptional regulator n=1 Tax=Acrocarpospora phusangensis TaxID=1070424 RepID=A0A919Q7J9_9ACTN|nr:MarR family transcriptional regulator [Acrocarpospora phusangensis]GIH22674.1 MarR family transcriptional regulator [Acrocarpospora phusangensis]